MYKLFLCLRYLRTRYIALASVISVTLGVATLIVVNSVMSGFQHEAYQRLHGILSDIVVEAHSLEGVEDPKTMEAEIRAALGEQLAGLTATVHVPAMILFQVQGQWIHKQVNLIGIDESSYSEVSDFGRYLLHPDNQKRLSFLLREGGYDPRLEAAGWTYRRMRVGYERALARHKQQLADMSAASSAPSAASSGPPIDSQSVASSGSDPLFPESDLPADPFAQFEAPRPETSFDPMHEQHTGIVLGIAISNIRHRRPDGEVADIFLCRPGDDVKVSTVTAGRPPDLVYDNFTVVDLYESKMSEYDAGFAFVPIRHLQQLRGMGQAVSSIQIKLREGADLNAARDRLRERFPAQLFPYQIQTWKELQGPLLSAVQMETTILNILLFLIIAVAGFGIQAMFSMIVVEKTRDIGILKALGASAAGVMSVFLGYGLSLGSVGAGAGLVLGLLFEQHINQIAALIERVTGHDVFDPTVYYFQEIPTIVSPLTITWILSGALAIAVLASILPALRAARMHPVESLRYE